MWENSPSLDRRAILRGTVTIAGTAVTLPLIGSLAGCNAAPASLANFMPLIRRIADRIIPETETPGAIAADVPGYVAAVFDAHFTAQQQSDFSAGLEAIADFAHTQGLAELETLETDELDAVLTKLASGEAEGAAPTAWQQLRDMVIFGFYTSEEATQELSYEQIPGRYEACVPFSEVGRAWLDRGV